jgi:tripartite ATP-independent transporter DctM subunit
VSEALPFLMFLAVFAALLAGYPVALTLAGVALAFALGGIATGVFAASDLGFLPGRLYGVIDNDTLIAVPLFVLMGVTLEKSRIAETLLDSMSIVMSRWPGGLGLAVTLVGMLMAASTGIVGATVVTMGLMSLPTMLRHGYDPRLATGTICATGTLGQIIPPSIALVLLGDVLSNAYQQAQLSQGIFAPKTVSVGDLFAGALVPGLVLVGLYVAYIIVTAVTRPGVAPKVTRATLAGDDDTHLALALAKGLVPPLLLIVAVLGSILGGYATPTEAAGVGAAGSLLLALVYRVLGLKVLGEICRSTLNTTAMVFFILIGASIFSLVFRGYGGDEVVQSVFNDMPGGMWGALAIVMLVIFLLGFILDFIEITFVVVPIVGPVLLAMGFDPVWLGVMIAVNLQTSFLTPPFGFALFYLRGVAPPEIHTTDIYRGVVPFIALQLVMLGLLVAWPRLATWLPGVLYG